MYRWTILSALETSQVPPTESESTPPHPRAWRPILPKIVLKSGLAEKSGNLTIQPARRPVPKFDGQVKIQPRWSECMKSKPGMHFDEHHVSKIILPCSFRQTWICCVAIANLSMIWRTLSPFSIETILMWSSSLTQTNKFLQRFIFQL